jgi:gamma-glutamyl:cysteine ligase YbdK (ATP-grasp superfamily)
MLSMRAKVLSLLPRHGAPPRFETWREWERLVDAFCAAGVITDYSAIHWDMRPHRNAGRWSGSDQPADIAHTAFVAMRGLCAWGVERDLPAADPAPRRLRPNRWAAARFSPRGTVHLRRGSVSAAELWQELVGASASTRVDATVCEGDAQLDIGRREGLDAATATTDALGSLTCAERDGPGLSAASAA